MENHLYDMTVDRLSTYFGTAQPLDSGNGARFTSARRGKATVYHANIAPGNRAELAFEPASMAKRLALTEREFRSLVADWRSRTGRDVQPDPQFNWPRVGISEAPHVEAIVADIARCLTPAA
ncbi:hypothetical protein [uncultured Azohydromonas sp.]|jgi:hypothetical protein|uniref:hypothetical protein n=1 Tax=uncultured Azohydromonas sp. TaxID=487342 RepID=UPI002635263A|nr:hypothetical protein [uncultured Azohydromonas sp.]